jgi:hypothetical protein
VSKGKSSKHQRSINLSSFKDEVASGHFEVWSFSGAWMLVLGI